MLETSNIDNIIQELTYLKAKSEKDVQKVFRKYAKDNSGLYKKSEVLYRFNSVLDENPGLYTQPRKANFLENIKMKNVRTISGVTPVTVLTKPYACPGKCIFCPSDVRMPKSYLSDEPGAQRAYRNKFDPYLQTYNRLLAFKNIGHPTDKIELIILGGTWTSYPQNYRIWFVKRCFDAMNDFEIAKNTYKELEANITYPFDETKLIDIEGQAMKTTYNKVVSMAIMNNSHEHATDKELFQAHKTNESAKSRCIGLVIETRPDEISIESILEIRKLGATKVQLGIQNMNNKVLKLNKRGHDVNKTREAINLLRQFGFKIHAHYMPNLYGSNPSKDILDYRKVFSDLNIRPDEIKIYPCSLIKSAELMQYYSSGLWKPYTQEELKTVLLDCIKNTPNYCRITRMVRDICSQDIVVGNKNTNFRQEVENELIKDGYQAKEIRLREIKSSKVSKDDLKLKITTYKTSVSVEKFIEYIDKDNKIAGFLRLSLPLTKAPLNELISSAIIREIHVYGKSIELGIKEYGKAQHLGLGKSLIKKASSISIKKGYKKLAVISSIGTREYYRKNGFTDGELYQHLDLINIGS